MVRFEEKKWVIEIDYFNPADYGVDVMRDLLNLIAIADKNLIDGEHDYIFNVCHLMLEMMPYEVTVREMLNKRGLEP